MRFTVERYKGNQWGIFSWKANCFVMFGKKKELIKRCAELNKPETKDQK